MCSDLIRAYYSPRRRWHQADTDKSRDGDLGLAEIERIGIVGILAIFGKIVYSLLSKCPHDSWMLDSMPGNENVAHLSMLWLGPGSSHALHLFKVEK